jgi:magnesium-transporting ATPase (P-type)
VSWLLSWTAGSRRSRSRRLRVLRRFNALNAISEDGSLLMVPPWVNPYLLLAMASSFVMHFVILYVPFLSSIFEIAPHNGVEWLVVVAFSFPVIIIGAYALRALYAPPCGLVCGLPSRPFSRHAS